MLLRQIVCIPLFPPQSCSRRPLPFTTYFWHWKPKIDPKSLVCASGRTYPDVFHLVFKLLSSTKPVNWWLRLACTLSRPESVLVLTRQRVRLPLFSVWSSSRRPLPFTNFFWHRKPKTDPKSRVYRRFRKYVSRCFPPWSCSAGPRHIADIFSWRPKPFLVVKVLLTPILASLVCTYAHIGIYYWKNLLPGILCTSTLQTVYSFPFVIFTLSHRPTALK